MRQLLLLFFACSLTLESAATPNWMHRTVQTLGAGALHIEDLQGSKVLEHRIHDPLIPASTWKLATSACALEALPRGFRFRTNFYRDKTNNLYMQGLGDPSLTSEELVQVSTQLAARGVSHVQDIVLDNAYFTPGLALDGQGTSLNPYHARNSALLVNFNAINFRKHANGHVESAEAQTPTVPLTKSFARGLKAGKYHINISRDQDKALHYVGELLRATLQAQGIAVHGSIRHGQAPQQHKPYLVYESSKTLEDNVQALLKYSNNLIANQLYLFLGIAKHNAPATPEKAESAMRSCLAEHFGWPHLPAPEGAGLSRKHRLTADQLMQLVRYFDQHQDLLPLEKKHFRAKTGTLNGVSTLAGFTTTPSGNEYRFVIMQNGKHATFHSKFEVAQSMRKALIQGGY